MHERRQGTSPFDMFGGGSMLQMDPFFSHGDPFESMAHQFDDFFGMGSRHRQMMDSMMRMGDMMSTMADNFGGADNGFVSYSSSSSMTSRNGVTETSHRVRDSRTGTEKVSIKRQIGDRAHLVERTRDRHGREQTFKHLENIVPEEETEFDMQWSEQAQDFPMWNSSSSSSRVLGPSRERSSRNRPLAIDNSDMRRSHRSDQSRLPRDRSMRQ